MQFENCSHDDVRIQDEYVELKLLRILSYKTLLFEDYSLNKILLIII